ncbi:MAG: rhodanese-like domain-containing protein [Myxococcota bacterium]
MSYDTFDVRTARAKQGEGWVYVDVRSPHEFAQGHPEGAVNVPILFMEPTGNRPNDAFLDVMRRRFPADTRLLMGCRSGARSARACELLEASGYGALANVAGGMLDWSANTLPESTTGTPWSEICRSSPG